MKESIVPWVLISLASFLLVVFVGKDVWQRRQRGAAHSKHLAQLRRNLLLKTLGNDSTVDSLIDLERERMPNTSLEVLMETAIERWERDNR